MDETYCHAQIQIEGCIVQALQESLVQLVVLLSIGVPIRIELPHLHNQFNCQMKVGVKTV
jgi:hypothetical protein